MCNLEEAHKLQKKSKGHNPNDKDNDHGSPQTKRKKVESGSGGSSSSKDGAAALLRCREDIQEAAEAERERREHERLFKGLRDADDLKGETSLLPLPPGMSGKDIAGAESEKEPRPAIA